MNETGMGDTCISGVSRVWGRGSWPVGGWGWKAERDRRWVGQVRVGVGRGGDVRRREYQRWTEVPGQGWEMSPEEGEVLDLGVEMGRDRETFALNLSAPFIRQFFGHILPYVDLLFGNESEAAAWAGANDLLTDASLSTIAKNLANLPRQDPSRPRVVVITSGPGATIVAKSGEQGEPKVYSVSPLPSSAIFDTNGAGDMFAGGYLGAVVLVKSADEAVEIGRKLGAMCVGQIGPQLRFPKENVV
ncbi:Ribokinase-like protein [Ceratobasidium sp. AG-I]|nr:Ribokinase-like protein [Ceratobasidium sp. AG-I]